MTPNTESGFKPGIEPGNDLPWAFVEPSALFGERLPGEGRGAGAGGSQGGSGSGGVGSSNQKNREASSVFINGK